MSTNPSALSAPLEPETAVVLDEWVRWSYESGLRGVAAQRQIDQLREENRQLKLAAAVAHHLWEQASAEAVQLLDEREACTCGASS